MHPHRGLLPPASGAEPLTAESDSRAAAGSAPTQGAHRDRILILDFGSQYTQLIARRIREANVYCEIHPPTMEPSAMRRFGPAGIVLSGGPASVLDEGSPRADLALLELDVPVLAICYGLQLLAHEMGGLVEKADEREFGRAQLKIHDADHPLFAHIPEGERTVWMSHGDRVLRLPDGFEVLGTSENSPFAAVRHRERPWFGLQFHPEVVHTDDGKTLLGNFVHGICGCSGSWTVDAFVEEAIGAVQEQVGDAHVVCGLSGGVDSSVAAALVHRAVGDRLTCIFVDHGLLRAREREDVERIFRDNLSIRLVVVDASERFLRELAGVVD
ncbi:MAG: glutamine-hydrolyzing GMP synthase, partial [Myxococcota bacterium]|nr:glutamine-hydrolyzing GMP synthase [Myxococcota bacterium]